eukprot:CAMPEP_0202004316 /NCGR_PEP_ID=MMETSP0905-20130828/9638_1 /ASSEMBLY_ACC=CAM_ASM_000554 /TAXON_ID=420261 /ORGANISM="Thalassiosira antarctica, Strain CCMP982" /LENGTH=37 /DNA_ID= /DNA_START= /DNA_END= /DNA_ORIENTATION=
MPGLGATDPADLEAKTRASLAFPVSCKSTDGYTSPPG